MKNIFLIVLFFLIANLYAQRGKNGAKVVSTSEIVNAYTTLTINANSGNSSISVANSNLSIPSLGNLSAGDLLMIIQMQGVSVEDTVSPSNVFDDSRFHPTWGRILNYNNCGNYEFVQVSTVPNNTTITLDCPLTLDYTVSGNVQVIRVPRYSSLIISNGGIITTNQWNGSTGGIVSIEVNGPTTINGTGTIDVSGLGFRGGQIDFSTTFGGNRYASTNAVEGGEKGEGIAGDWAFYDANLHGRYTRGAAANAGGGGTAHNAGGGGGANAGNLLNWNNGTGVPNPTFNTSWSLETPSIAGLNSSGGGRGGYSHGGSNGNELTQGPGHPAWGGDGRRQVGGLGGRPLDYSSGKIFMGGGGGAGDGEDTPNPPGAGGNGAGIIYLSTYGNVSGTGTINANGQNGFNCEVAGNPPFNTITGKDAAGGAGAGGTILIKTTGSVSGINLNANGGSGGNQVLKTGTFANIGEVEGPGGGGGGGYIAITNGTPTRNANGGVNGTTNSTYVTNFPPNGATSGGIGMPTETISTYDITVRDTTICSNTLTTLTATVTGTNPGGLVFEWYDSPMGGTLLFTGNPFVTPILSATTTYYLRACPTPFRIPVTVTVNSCTFVAANFRSTDSTLCASDCIDFTDLSTGVPTAWTWYFPGSSTPTSSSQNPTNICYNTPGSYNVMLVASNATSSDSLFMANFITVTANDTATISYTSINYCLTDPNPSPTITGTSGGTFTINNSGIINGTTGVINITGSGVGNYVITYITNGSCPDTATFNVTITNSADATITQAGPFCLNDPALNLSAAGSGGVWSGLGITNTTNGTFNPTISGPGNHVITYTISGSCGDVDTMTILVNPQDTAAFTYSSGSFCLTDPNPSPTITGTTGGTFTINNSGVINGTTGVINITGSGVGNYIVTYITNGTCPDTATFNIVITNSTDATITQAGPFCINDPSLNLTAVSTGGNWAGVGITDSINGTFSPSTAGVGNHIITYSISGSCGDIDTMTIIVTPKDTATFSYAANSFCNTATNPLPTIVTTGGTFTIDNGGTINPTSGEISLLTSGVGNYIITYITNGTCPDTATFNISITNCSIPPVAGISASTTSICINDCINFNDISSGGIPTAWTWYFEGGNPSTSNTQNPTNICYDTAGTYNVALTVSNAFGQDSIFISNYITVDSCNLLPNVIVIPNVFSPNGDGQNDLFNVSGNFTSISTQVYNRWGELLFKTSQLNSGWDGRTTSGSECPEGTYFYIIKTDIDTYKGTVTLIR